MKLTFIEEPDLEFGNGSRHIAPGNVGLVRHRYP